MKEFEQIVQVAYLVILGLLLLLLIGRYFYYQKTKISRIPLQEEASPFRYFRYVTLLVLPFFIIGFVQYIFVLQKGNLFAMNWMKMGLVGLLALVVITEIFYNLHPRPKTSGRILNGLLLLISLGLGGLLHATFYSANQYPSKAESVSITLPFKGTWIASGAGATGATNHHDRIASQKYAIDISRLGEDSKLFTGEGVKNEESYTFGAPIYAPVQGEVVHVVDTLPDVKVRERDKLAGNHIIIRFQDSLYVALAHLKQGTIRVKQGAQVQVGQELGEVGLSGNTDFSHLHIHIQDMPTYNIETTRTYPIRFKNFERKRYFFWARQEDGYLLSNDIVREVK